MLRSIGRLARAQPSGRKSPPPARSRQAGRRAASISDGLLVQAGSFKSRDNADKARTTLAAIAPVEVAEIEAGGNTYFRVRVGPFADQMGADAALAKVNEAGYQGAKIITKN